jgi:hypothetical protein
MIIRPAENSNHLLLITQPDHAALAAACMAAWQGDGFPASERRDEVLFATLHHDDGWLDVDTAPLVSEADGRLLDFISAPDEVRLAIWPRAVERLQSSPYVAALVAQHALQIYEPYRRTMAAAGFFDRLEALRERHLAAAAPRTFDDLVRDYFFVQMGDTLSLTFCNRWTGSRRVAGYEIRFDGFRLTVDPDPFDRVEVPLSVPARRLPRRPFSQTDARNAFEAAPVVPLTGVLSGPPITVVS